MNQNPSPISQRMDRVTGSRRGTGSPAAHGAATSAPAAGDAATSVQVAGVPAWWTASSLEAFFRHDSSPTEGMYPPGGFTNFLQSNQFANHPNENNSPSPKGTPSGGSNSVHDVNAEDKETIDVDADETLQYARTDKRLTWTKAEDVRLAAAWLHNSKDPVDGNDRKSDQYWADVTEEYNKTTESCCMLFFIIQF